MMCIWRTIWVAMTQRKPTPLPDPALVQLAVAFRSSQSADVSSVLDQKDELREDLLAARAEVDALKTFRREAEMTLMRNGLDVPEVPER